MVHGPRSVHGRAAGRDRPGQRGRRRRGGGRGAASAAAELGPAARPRARQVPVPHRADPPGAQPRVRGPRDDRLRQTHQGVAGRRHPARGGPLLVLRGLGGQARLRLSRPHRARPGCRRAGDPVELPAAHAGLEDRAGAGGRQHGRPQAGQFDAAHGAPLRRRLPPGGPAARHGEHRHGTRRDRHGPGHAPGRGQGGLHRLDGGGQGDRTGHRRIGQGADPGARRQGGQHRLRRRAPRPGHRGHRQRHLLQPGRGLLRRQPAAGTGVDRRACSSRS